MATAKPPRSTEGFSTLDEFLDAECVMPGVFTANGNARVTCHCAGRNNEAIPRLMSHGRLIRQGIASSLRSSQ